MLYGLPLAQRIALCEPLTRNQVFQSAIACLLYQTRRTQGAWFSFDWRVTLTLLCDMWPQSIAENVRVDAFMKREKRRLFDREYGFFRGDLKDFDRWLLQQVENRDEKVIEIIKFFYIPAFCPADILQGDGILGLISNQANYQFAEMLTISILNDLRLSSGQR